MILLLRWQSRDGKFALMIKDSMIHQILWYGLYQVGNVVESGWNSNLIKASYGDDEEMAEIMWHRI